ncbi:MAG: YhbY family RNA-binding protein [Casimicrobiaceae bacterium]
MTAITASTRRELRARAHHLHPVVNIGQHGLTPAVLHEIDVNLIAHELIKIRVFSDARADRDAMLERICGELGAAPVQHLGKLLVVWRAAPKETADKAPPSRRAAPAGKSAARKAPQSRRPRSPLPRTPARPPPRGKSPADLPGPPASERRRKMTNAASTWETGPDDRSKRRSKGTASAKGAAAP